MQRTIVRLPHGQLDLTPAADGDPQQMISLACDAAADMITAMLEEGAGPADPALIAAADMATRMLAAMLDIDATPAADVLATWNGPGL